MVSERKLIQPEATSTFKNKYGFQVDTTRDFIRCPKCYYGIYPDSARGRFDTIIGYPVSFGKMYWGAVEVKNGTKTSLPFASVADSQREWYEKKKEEYFMWLWFSIGERIGGKKYPRRTWLIPFNLFLELENSLNRKSISADCEQIKEYELEWSGKGQWVIPDEHLLWETIMQTKNEGVMNEVV
ncbi:MAG TPA: hypothetical protein ENG48_11090 [Candidatus Atribacteria bacterium]|nr:hypothetical protein [Candidatus Atribacteria bacterium]